MFTNAKVPTTQFNAMCEQLSKLSAVPHKTVVRAEVGKVLEKTLEHTKSASVSRIRHRYDEFVPLNKRVYYMGNRYRNELWAQLKSRRKQLIERTLAARGLAKQSWLQLANQLGIKIAFPGYVASAVPKTGKTYNNVRATERADSKGVSISIVNGQPTANAIGGERALNRAIQGRIKFFERNANLAVFADVKKIAKSYPGLKIKTA